jgi:hypothetical protein
MAGWGGGGSSAAKAEDAMTQARRTAVSKAAKEIVGMGNPLREEGFVGDEGNPSGKGPPRIHSRTLKGAATPTTRSVEGQSLND